MVTAVGGRSRGPAPIITFDAVRFAYPALETPALDGVSLEIARASVVGISGQNGSGKTTLVKLVNGLLRPDAGRVTVDGLDAARARVRELAAHAALAFQNPTHQLFASTVADELAFGPRNLGVEEDEVLARVSLAASRLGLSGVLDRHPYRLGAAGRKLVSVASVLTMQTPVVVLDEPTTGQDHRTVRTLAELICELRGAGVTVLVVAHDMAFHAEVADRLVVLDRGRVIAEGAPRTVFADGALMARAGLVAPQITELSQRLHRPDGADPWPALTVGELAAALGEGTGPGGRGVARANDAVAPGAGAVGSEAATGGPSRHEQGAGPMRRDGTLEGGPWLLRTSPIPKLTWLLAVLCVALVAYHPVPLLAVAAVGVGLAAVSGLGRPVLSGLLVLSPLAASIVVVQSTAPGICGACTPAATLGPLTVHQEGLARSLSLISRVLAMEVTAIVVFGSTRPSDLVAALRRLRVPYVLGFMLTMTLELVPIVRREVGLVLSAQRARGMRRAGFGAVLPAFVPVFAATFERTQQLAISLEARGFGTAGPRTSYRRVRFGAVDRVLTLAGAVAGVAGVALGLTTWGADRVPVPAVPESLALGILVVSGVVFVGVVLAGARAIVRL